MPLPGFFSRWVARLGFRLFKIDELNAAYDNIAHLDGLDFVDGVFTELNVDLQYDRAQLAAIPTDGPFVVVANHPHGMMDGLALMRIIAEVRSDFRVVVNEMLSPVGQLDKQFLPIRRLDNLSAAYSNGKAILSALRKGTPLVFFPAGSVAFFHPRELRIRDKDWDRTCLRFLRQAKAPIVPMHIDGRAPFAYHLFYNTFKMLSLAWLVRGFFAQRNTTVNVRIGEVLIDLPDDEAGFGLRLREAVELLPGS